MSQLALTRRKLLVTTCAFAGTAIWRPLRAHAQQGGEDVELIRGMPANDVSASDSKAIESDAVDYRYNGGQFWRSSLDLLNRQPILSSPSLTGDRKANGVPARLPNGEIIKDRYTPGQFYVATPADAPDLQKVADAGRRLGESFRIMLNDPESSGFALSAFNAGLGANLGHAGTFDYQREGHIGNYIQHRQFRDISNINVGVFSRQAGLTLEETLAISGRFAQLRSSNAKPLEPYSLDPRTRYYIEAGYGIAAPGVFDRPPAALRPHPK